MTDPNKHPVQVVDLLSPAAIRLDVEALSTTVEKGASNDG